MFFFSAYVCCWLIVAIKVPSICIEYVYLWNNTSIVVDEVLAQRLGLIPLNVDPAMLEMKECVSYHYQLPHSHLTSCIYSPSADQATDHNTLVFHLNVKCERKKSLPKDSTNLADLYTNHEVLSSHLQWEPQTEEQALVFQDCPPAPSNLDIVIAKLRPGQEIDVEVHAVKGVGKDHAKFTPVGKLDFVYALLISITSTIATASYRILPLIILNPQKPVPPKLATKFQKCFAPGVIHIDARTQVVSVDEKNMRKDTVSREVLRHPEFAGCVELKRVRDFFLCECLRPVFDKFGY